MDLMPHQLEAMDQLESGNILWGGVGTGKSRTVLAWIFSQDEERDVYVITTAKKRDSLDWEKEAAKMSISPDPECTLINTITIDSWNNIGKYEDVKDAFFIFDEQRVVGRGAWVKSFLKITKHNKWVLLSATPGDTWIDYIPVFVANGFYKNATEFKRDHVIYAPYVRYPIVLGYRNEAKLERLRSQILVEMPYLKDTERAINWLDVGYDTKLFGYAWKKRWNVFEDRPIKDVSELFFVLRKIVNSDPSRLDMLKMLMTMHKRLIVFYNFNYELHILRSLKDEIAIAEWNGHRHEPLPDTERWLYLVQYNSGSESWNCTDTNAMVFYSLTYSYKNFIQAQGRIDRLDTKFKTLYYYILWANSFIDRGVKLALDRKHNFNERVFARKNLEIEEFLCESCPDLPMKNF